MPTGVCFHRFLTGVECPQVFGAGDSLYSFGQVFKRLVVLRILVLDPKAESFREIVAGSIVCLIDAVPTLFALEVELDVGKLLFDKLSHFVKFTPCRFHIESEIAIVKAQVVPATTAVNLFIITAEFND